MPCSLCQFIYLILLDLRTKFAFQFDFEHVRYRTKAACFMQDIDLNTPRISIRTTNAARQKLRVFLNGGKLQTNLQFKNSITKQQHFRSICWLLGKHFGFKSYCYIVFDEYDINYGGNYRKIRNDAKPLNPLSSLSFICMWYLSVALKY